MALRSDRGKPLVLRGSLIVLRRRCGTLTCRCATGEPHESPALSYSEGGKTRILTLRPEDVREVRAALDRYKKPIAALDRQAESGLRQLSRRLEARRRAARGGR